MSAIPEVQPSREDGQIVLDGLEGTQARVMLAVRLLLQAAENPDLRFDVPSLAKESGLSEWQVRQIMCSKEYEDLVVTQGRSVVSGYLYRGVEKAGAMLEKDLTPSQLSQVMGTLSKVYAVFSDHDGDRNNVDRREQLKSLGGKVEALNRLKKADFEIRDVRDSNPGS